MRRMRIGMTAVVALALGSAAHAQDASTYRGNAARTGCADGKPGPAAPNVLWAHPSKDHYVASPTAAGDRLYVSGLGAFNLPSLSAIDTAPKPASRVAWSLGAPGLKLPTVSSPAVSAGRLIFGDGMHQTDGAVLHAVDAETGLTLWQYSVPGTLVHLEGSPTVVGDKVFIGGGAAGVLCVDASKLTFEGKPAAAAEIRKVLAERWKALQAKYEQEKKTNPDFAVPPSADQLPKASPALVWQAGKTTWHVDAPVAVVGDKVLVGSAFLDKEKVGDRALYCLDAATGTTVWRKALKLNPWGGPSVLGDVVVVSGSSISYDPQKLKGAKGFVAAFNLADGAELWNKETPGGVLSCAALAEDAAIATATDGKVRAFDLKTGERKWIYEAKTSLFAPPAVSHKVVYAADNKGMIHAIDLTTGTAKWTLDLGEHPATKAPGMVYGGPAIHGGRLYVATCNLEGPFARKDTVVVAIGEK